MKAFHRIRGCLLLLLVMPHALRSGPSLPPSFDFKNCFTTHRCAVHDSCITDSGNAEDKYRGFDKRDLAKLQQCNRYIAARSTSSDSVEIEFRDDTLTNAAGATVKTQGLAELFGCKEKGGKMQMTTAFGTASSTLTATLSSGTTLYSKLYCKVTLRAAANENMPTLIRINQPETINSKEVSGLELGKLKFECSWSDLIHVKADESPTEEFTNLENGNDQVRRCPADFFNWVKKEGEKVWKNIEPDFSCTNLKIQYQETPGGLPITVRQRDQTKCTRPKCAKCDCPFCDGGEGRPQFHKSDKGKTCTQITCGKYMLLTPDNGPPFVHPNASLHCFHESGEHGTAKWGRSGLEGKEGYGKLLNATCIDEVDCAVLSPIASECPALPEDGKNCTKASLNGTEAPVCDADHETWYRPGAGIASRVDSVVCNGQTGSWKIANETYQRGSNVYCLKAVGDNGAGARSRPAGANAGTIIGAIVGVCVCIFIIVIIIVLCWRRKLLKKGNRDEMPSVSITGKKSKKKRGKKGSGSLSTGSKTSEQISAPPPPPCPDSLNFVSEPEPHRPQSSAQPSSGGPASVPAVGPDTGKPDKPAELIDIKLESQKKDSTESKRAKPAQSDTTVVNTITGTSIASKVEPAKGADASGRSDTGTGTGASGRKKKNKMELDKHGRGLTDDEEYNIDEGAKPINLEDKNKKPYKPAVDPNKQMINVTVTEDEDGKMKPKLKPSLF